jgi:hypothetical protein
MNLSYKGKKGFAVDINKSIWVCAIAGCQQQLR